MPRCHFLAHSCSVSLIVTGQGLERVLASGASMPVKVRGLALLPFLLPGFKADAPVPRFIHSQPFRVSGA